MQVPTLKCSLISFTFTFLLVLLSLNPASSAAVCNTDDQKSLLEIKYHFNNASTFTTWDPNTDCCTNWSGIQCDAQGRVTMLANSIANDVVGEIPPAMGELPYLQFLAFSNLPQLSGTIPSFLSKLTNLQHLDLSLNNLTGPIPDFLSQLKDLDDIDLSSNSLTGSIPSSLSQLPKLRTINLGTNKLSGPIPPSLGSIKSLVQIYFYSNSLSGSIPSSLSRLHELNELALWDNKLTGTIPASFGSFRNPDISLDLSSNKLSGSIPRSFGKANITQLDISKNKFTGDASFLFSRDKTVLSSIVMSNNLFKFDFSNVDLPLGLKRMDISHNMIFGSLPKQLGQLPLYRFDVSFNQLCGKIPTGRRLKQFDAAKFSNNKCLCGLPLPPCN